MLYQIMREIRNFFPAGNAVEDTYVIRDGSIDLPFLIKGQFFLIEGSILNNGVFCYNEDMYLNDETFHGYITPLAPPQEFLDLAKEIRKWTCENMKNSGKYQSESFGGYTYTLATNRKGNAVGWKDVFESRLNTWRKI